MLGATTTQTQRVDTLFPQKEVLYLGQLPADSFLFEKLFLQRIFFKEVLLKDLYKKRIL